MKATFNDKQSAINHANKNGGKVHDNRHNSTGYRGNDFTVKNSETKSEHALYSKQQLQRERSIGLQMSDRENENYFKPIDGDTYHWSAQEFENWLATKQWSEESKNSHREQFEGVITFEDGSFWYGG